MPIEVESPEEFGYGRIVNNLSESSIRDRTLAELDLTFGDLTLHYGSHRGDDRLRALIATASGGGLTADNVLVTAGAAGALFIIATTLLERGDHLIVVRPNYATNIETPRAIGCDITYVDLAFADGFRVDITAITAALRSTTRLISVTCPHNPTGTMMTRADLQDLVALAERHGCRLLVDETYRDMSYGQPLPTAASLSLRAISVASMSKSFGVPGIRIGWLITQDEALYDSLLAAKEQIGICGSVLDEAVAAQVLSRRKSLLADTAAMTAQRFRIVKDWIDSEPLIDWVAPAGGVVCLPRLTGLAGRDMAAFHRRLLVEHGTYVGPGHWFEMPPEFVRIGFGWSTERELRDGLAAITSTMRAELAAG
jgi:aspartate/methionine/tyrosine aminotransferase